MRAKEFIEGDILPFKPRDTRTDQEKYDDAVIQQSHKRPDVGVHPCKHCGDVYCDYDCYDSQEEKYASDIYDPEVAADLENLGNLLKNAGIKTSDYMDVDEDNAANVKALVGSGRADPIGKKTNPDSTAHKKVRTPTTTYSKDRKKYNNGAKPGANDGFVGG